MDNQDWKEKYLQSLEQLEAKEKQWEVTSALLRQGISRVALVAQGMDSKLDHELSALRKHITQRAMDPATLETIIEDLSVSVARLDEARHDKQAINSPQKLVSNWLDSLNPPRQLKKPLKALRKAINQTSGFAEMADSMEALAQLLNAHYLQNQRQGKGGLFQRLLGDSARKDATQGDEGLTDKMQCLRDFSMQLINQLQLPHELTEQTKELKEKLAASDTEQDIKEALGDIASLISSLREQIAEETGDFQEFLRQLTERLQEIDQHIAHARDHQQHSLNSGRQLDEAVHNQVKGIQSTVDNTTDPAQLKHLIQERLDAIRQHLDQFRNSEAQNHKQFEARVEELNQRILNMESEGELLRERLKEKHELALRDALTGLPNRLAYNERIVQEYSRWKRYGKPVALTLVDIDYFKKINDTYGHNAGDKALILIAKQLKERLRESDFLARFGGEEFAVIMPETSLDEGLVAANKLREAVMEAKFHYQGANVSITISSGLAQLRTGDSTDTLFQRADKALYKAKENGRNRCELGLE